MFGMLGWGDKERGIVGRSFIFFGLVGLVFLKEKLTRVLFDVPKSQAQRCHVGSQRDFAEATGTARSRPGSVPVVLGPSDVPSDFISLDDN